MGTLNNVLIFAAGAAIGSVAAWKILSVKYEERLQAEIESVKESFEMLHGDSDDNTVEEEESVEVEDNKMTYDDLVTKHNYNTSFKKEKEDSKMTEPYEIPYEDFGERDGYDANTMTYYSDGVLTDEDDNPIEDVLGMVGCDLGARFKEKDNDPNDKDRDSIYIRNEDMECDLEILRDYRSFSSVTGYRSPVYGE